MHGPRESAVLCHCAWRSGAAAAAARDSSRVCLTASSAQSEFALRDELASAVPVATSRRLRCWADPDHAHSCSLQQGVSVKQRHDSVKQVLAELARSCGFHVEVEPRFPRLAVCKHLCLSTSVCFFPPSFQKFTEQGQTG